MPKKAKIDNYYKLHDWTKDGKVKPARVKELETMGGMV